MEVIPHWLLSRLRRLVQYVAVMVASMPAGVLYILLKEIIAPQIALLLSLPVALSMAYFVWRWLDKNLRSHKHVKIFASEGVLRRGWESREEDEAWAHL